jgi:HSP20 family protein
MVFNGNLIPWNWGKKNLPIRKENDSPGEHTSYLSLQQDMNRAFENFFRTFDTGMMLPFSDLSEGIFQPRVEVKESANDVRVSVELPGIDDKDLDVSITDKYLTIKGEKREEKESNTSGYYRMERTYGSFHRSIPFPCEIDKDKAKARFKCGVLTVTLPKTVNSQQQIKKISVKKE